MKIQYLGLVRSPTGHARVGRGLATALAALGHAVRVSEPDEPLLVPDFPLDPSLASLVGPAGPADLTIAYVHPARWAGLHGRVRVGILSCDTSPLPSAWVRAAEAVDLVAVPSEFVREVATGSGIPAGRIELVPFGHDPAVFRLREAAKDGPFTFLHVAGPFLRKATSAVVQAFREATGNADDVRLVLKTHPASPEGVSSARRPPRPYLAQVAPRELVARFAGGDSRIEVIEEPLSDAAMGGLVRDADVLVQPSFGEGFSLVTLEAMACGVPAIATNWGGHLDYCGRESAFLLHAGLFPAMDLQYDLEGDPAWSRGIAARPAYEHLIEAMRLAFERRDILAAKGRAARAAAAPFTWEQSARTLLEALARRSLLADAAS